MYHIPESIKDLDFHTANNDFSGVRRVFPNSREDVAYQNDSTMRIWYNNVPVSYNEHWHNSLEIIMPIENDYTVSMNGKTIKVLPEEAILIPPREVHSLSAPETGSRFIFLFDLSPMSSLKGFAGIQSLLSQTIHVTKERYPKIYDDVMNILLQIRNEYFSETEYRELTIYALLMNMLVKFGYDFVSTEDLFPNVRLYKQREYVQKFNNLMDYIDAHYMEDLNLEDIASATGFSKYHFSRLFKQYTNYTFCDYLCYRRIKAAEELLAKAELSITEVALQSGFPSISTFNRLFKQQKSCTPSEYRTKHNNYKI